MVMIEGIGDEVTWFAVATLLMILVLSVPYLWNAFIDHPTSIIHQPSSGPDEELHGAVNSAVGEENVAENGVRHDGNNPSAATDTNDGNVEDDGRTEELNSCNGDETAVVESCSGGVKAEHNNIDTSGVSDLPFNENLQQHSSSPAVMRRTLVNSGNSNNVTSTRPLVRNESSAPSAVSTVSETEQTYPDQIVLRIKYLNDMERTVSTRLSKIIADFKRDHFSEELAANKTVRLIFNGQLLRNEVTLQHYGVSDGCVVHVHISQSDPQRPAAAVESNLDLDLSHLLWPLLSIVLVLLWISYFRYPQFFNMTSTGILLIFTGGFIFVYGENRNEEA